MTVCVSVKVGEGLVLAADSVVTMLGEIDTPDGPQQQVMQTFEYANKVTRLKDYPIGVMTWGAASVGDRSIQSLIMEFEYGAKSCDANVGYTVLGMAQELGSFLRPVYDAAFPDPAPRPGLGLLVGGYSSGEFFADEYKLDLPLDSDWQEVRVDQPNGRPAFGADWFGQTGPLVRLVRGFDPGAFGELVKRGVDQAVLEKWVNDGVSAWPIIFDGMPLQDAVDFAQYAAQVTLGWFRFGLGPAICGGDIDIAVITPNAFQWSQRKQWAIK